MSRRLWILSGALLLIAGMAFFAGRAQADAKEVVPIAISALPTKNAEMVLADGQTIRNMAGIHIVSYGGTKMFLVRARSAEDRDVEYFVNPDQVICLRVDLKP